MARAIQFHAPNAPNFGEANDLTLKSMELGNHAVKSITDTWNNAVKAVENRNHAEMKQMIDAYNYQQLQDPNVINQVQNDIKRLGLETGNMYDPTVVQTYLDTRADTLLKREAEKLQHQSNGIAYDNAVIANKDNKLKFDDSRKTYLAKDLGYALLALNPKGDEQLGAKIIQQYAQNEPTVVGRHIENTSNRLQQDAKVNADNNLKYAQAGYDDARSKALNMTTPVEVQKALVGIEKDKASIENMQANTVKTLQDMYNSQNAPTAQQKVMQERIDKAGLPPNIITHDGKFDNNVARNHVMLSVAVAKNKANNHFDMSYEQFVMDKKPTLVKANKDLPPEVMRDLGNVILEQASKSNITLTPKERIVLETGILTGLLPYERILNGTFFGMSNYEGALEELGNQYLKYSQAVSQKEVEQKARDTYIEEIKKISQTTGMSALDIVSSGVVPNEELYLLPDNFIPQSMKGLVKKPQSEQTKEESKKTVEQRLIEESNRYKTTSQNNRVKESDEITGGIYGW